MVRSPEIRRVLLTGASGFIGRACIAPLRAAGFEIHALSRGRSPAANGVVGWACDLMDPAAVRTVVREVEPSHLLHTAWDVTHGVFWTAPNNLRWLAASVDLLAAFRDAGGQRAVGVGTCAEYGWTSARYREADAPTAAATPYGLCKRALGDAFAAAAGLGLSTAWARVFFPYGHGDAPQRLIPSLMASLADGRRFAATEGSQLRDFIHVADVGAALAAVLSARTQGAINIARGEPVALRDIIETIARLMGRTDLLDLGALPIRPSDPPELVADTARLTSEVGFIPGISLDEGLACTVAAFRAETVA